MNYEYINRIMGGCENKESIVDFFPGEIKNGSFHDMDDFLFYLDYRGYFDLAYYTVEKINELLTASAPYCDDFRKKLRALCLDYLSVYFYNDYLTGFLNALDNAFRRYSDDPNRLEWTPENVDRYLFDFYCMIEKNPWNGQTPKYTPDWFKERYQKSYDAIKLVWGPVIGLKDNSSERLKTAVKMVTIASRQTNYYD